MIDVLKSLDAREIAVAIWLAIFFIWCLTKSDVRKSLGSLLVAASARQILIAFALAIAYLSGVTVLLRHLDLWTLYQFKITMLWFFVAGIPSLMNTTAISEDPTLLRAAVAKNFKLSVLLDFFINLFKLPLLAELIFVPFTALLGGLLAVAQSDEKYGSVKKLLDWVMISIGLVMFVFEVYKALTSFNTIANASTLRDFTLPIIYNITFIPLLWVMSLYSAYESVFCRLQFVIRDRALHPYTRRKLIVCFRTDIVALHRWLKAAWSENFASRSDVAQSIATVARARDAA
ncbi:MAG: hypothetical protein ACYC0F_12040 [Rhodanobacter sp.]